MSSMSKAYTAAWRAKHPDKQWASNLKLLYGITVAEYDAMWKKQGGRCGACRLPETATYKGVVKRLAVDHNHETGQVRGLLCLRCNRALGLLQDDPVKLERLREYLLDHQ